ncbi:MAG TPA: tetratricopeptide repeat protein [Candidatus Dormibacteraeota bacterium]|nr:tetratricopeptide repeat protein [Candidatus Dormibacteraeota bacterium]
MAAWARRVFLSYTSELHELPRDRSFVAAAEAAISRAGNVVTDMAHFTARDVQPAEYCARMLAASDVYVGIIGFRYGSPVRDRPDVSYVELEYDIATERQLPRLIFLLDEETVSPLPANRIIDHQYGQRQQAFRTRLKDAGPTVAIVATPAELEGRLLQALLELAGGDDESAVDGAGPIGWSIGVPLGRQPAEVRGREGLLRTLLDARGLVVLTAMGGMGKSTVAAELTQRVPAGWPVWWVAAADASSLTAGMVTVARRLGASQADLRALATQAGDAPDRFWTMLERRPEGWLLVFDNADDPVLLAAPGGTAADGTGWVRASSRGLVLVTTRQADQATWGRDAQVVRLGPLPDAEAAQVLLDLAPQAGERAQAEALGRRLGGLPLALHLCGRHLQSAITRWFLFASFLQALGQEPDGVRLLSPDPDTPQGADPRAAVMQTWELSLDDLARSGLPQARSLLRLLSCFAPGIPIPVDLLEATDLSGLLDAVSAKSMDTQLHQALRGLERLGLVDTVAGQRSVAVHPVIADVNRAHLQATSGRDPMPELVWRTAVRAVAAAVLDLDWRLPPDWPRFLELTPHVRALFDVAGQSADRALLASLLNTSRAVVNANHMAGTIPPAADLTEAALAHGAELGAQHPTILAFRQHRAYQARERGHWAAAEEGFRDVLLHRRRVLGPEHHDTLDTRFHLALTMARRGRDADAEVAFREVLNARRRLLGADHPDVLETHHELTRTITAQGRWTEAERHFRALLETQRRALGADHPATMYTRHYLARHVARFGRWEAIESVLRGLLTAARDRPDMAAAEARWAEADAGFRALLDSQRRVLGDDHPATLATRVQLARLASDRGHAQAAAASLRAILEVLREMLGDDHPDVLEGREHLAWADARQAHWLEAESRFRELLAIRERVHGDEHRYTLATRHSLACALAGRDRLAEAEAALRGLLAVRQRVIGEHHPDTLATRVELIRTLVARQRCAQADIEMAREALSGTRRLVLGDPGG